VEIGRASGRGIRAGGPLVVAGRAEPTFAADSWGHDKCSDSATRRARSSLQPTAAVITVLWSSTLLSAAATAELIVPQNSKPQADNRHDQPDAEAICPG
jgi:hypothetical protein